MTELTLTEARASLPSLLDRVAAGEEVTITRHGAPVAVLIRPDILRTRRVEQALRAADEQRVWRSGLRGKPLSGALTPGRADELVAEIRTDRQRP